MSIATHFLGQSANIIHTTVDKHGDEVATMSDTPVSCRFRYITEIDKGTNREGETSSEAIIWLEPDAGVIEGSIIEVEGIFWRVNKLIKARQMSGSTIMFLKAFVKRHQLVMPQAVS